MSDYWPFIGVGSVFALIAVSIAGWVTNVIWLFSQHEIGPILLGLVGALVPPLGAIHGIWLWL